MQAVLSQPVNKLSPFYATEEAKVDGLINADLVVSVSSIIGSLYLGCDTYKWTANGLISYR